MNNFKQMMQPIIEKAKAQTGHNQHEMNGMINEDAKRLVDMVFQQLAAIFPAWGVAWKTPEALNAAKKEWVKGFVENQILTTDQLRFGFRKARAANSDFLPSVGKFVKWCEPNLEDYGFISEQEAHKVIVQYHNRPKDPHTGMRCTAGIQPILIAIHDTLDWYSFCRMNEEKAYAAVAKAATNLLKKGWNPSHVQTMDEAPRIQHKAEVRKSNPEVARKHLQEMKARFGKK